MRRNPIVLLSLLAGLIIGCGSSNDKGPCSPNPCSETNRTTCNDTGGAAVCICNPGFAESPTGDCVPDDGCDPDCQYGDHCEVTSCQPNLCNPVCPTGETCVVHGGAICYCGNRGAPCPTGHHCTDGDCIPDDCDPACQAG